MQVAQVPASNGAGPTPEHVKKRDSAHFSLFQMLQHVIARDFGVFSLYHVLTARRAGTKTKEPPQKERFLEMGRNKRYYYSESAVNAICA